MKQNKGYIYAAFSVFAWGTMAPISKVLLNGYSNMEVLGYLFWAVAMQKNATGVISNFAYATPVISLILSFLFLKEYIAFYMLIGILLIFAGIILQVYQNLKKV